MAQDTFAGSWSGDQSADFGSKNFLRTSYGTDSKGILGTEGGSDNKVTYLKFDISQIDLNQADHVKLQMSLLGLRYDEAKIRIHRYRSLWQRIPIGPKIH